MKRTICFILAALFVLLFTACNTGKNNTTTSTTSTQIVSGSQEDQTASAEYDDTIVFSFITDVTSLDCQFANDGYSWSISKMVYNNLVKYNSDDEITADLAESYELSDDGLTWRFKLRQGIMFHNGKSLTVDDVKFTFDRALDPGNGFPITNIINMVDSTEIIDGHTFAIHLKYSFGPFLNLLASPFLGILDREYVEKYGDSFGLNAESINGTGPYKLVSWSTDEEVVLVRNEEYFGTLAKTKNLIYRPIPDASARIIALETGEVDFIYSIPTIEIPRLQENANITVSQKSGIGVMFFRFGCNDTIMSNSLVRQAINFAVDRREIYEVCFKGRGEISTAPMGSGIWGYKNLGVIEQDLDKARALLAQAGYPDGFETRIITTPFYDKSTEAAEIMSDQLAKIGITARIEVLEWSTHVEMRSGKTPDEFDWPIFFMGMGSATGDADGMMRGLLTTTETGTNVRNYGFYSNQELDELVFEAMGETDPVRRKELYEKAANILYFEDPPGVYLIESVTVAAYTNKLENPTISRFAYFTFENATKKK